jgi:hypothetical protein
MDAKNPVERGDENPLKEPTGDGRRQTADGGEKNQRASVSGLM